MGRLPRAAQDLRVQELSGEALVFQPRLQRTVALDAEGSRVLRLCLVGAPTAEALAEFPHLERILESLRQQGLLAPDRLPLRRQDLILQEIGDETLVMDPASLQVHRLNRTAARVLALCDGTTPVAGALDSEAPAGAAEDALWMALALLREKRLLQAAPSLPEGGTRRAFLKRWGRVAALLPVVASLAIPAPALAQSAPTCFQGSGQCAAFFGVGARVSTCVPCCAPAPCSCPNVPPLFCMTAYNTTGTSCQNDTVISVECNTSDVGGIFNVDCTAARGAVSSPGVLYACCDCSATP